MKIRPVQVGTAPGAPAAKPLPYTVKPLMLPPDVFARLSKTGILGQAWKPSDVAEPTPLTGFHFPLSHPTVLPPSVLGGLAPGTAKPILVVPPAAPAAVAPPTYVPLGNGYWLRPLPATALANVSHTAAISQIALDGLKTSSYAGYLPSQMGSAVEVFAAAIALGEIYQEIAAPKVEGPFKKFLFFAKRAIYFFRGVTVFVPVSSAIDQPLKAVGTVLKIGDEVAAIQWRKH